MIRQSSHKLQNILVASALWIVLRNLVRVQVLGNLSGLIKWEAEACCTVLISLLQVLKSSSCNCCEWCWWGYLPPPQHSICSSSTSFHLLKLSELTLAMACYIYQFIQAHQSLSMIICCWSNANLQSLKYFIMPTTPIRSLSQQGGC